MYLLQSVTVVVLVALAAATGDLHLPPYIEGTPTSAQVISLEPADYRGLPVYKITFEVRTNAKTSEYGVVHRHYGEFQTLSAELPGNWPLPVQGSANELEELTQLLQSILADAVSQDTAVFHDFLGINWNAQGVEWFKDLQSFLHMVMLARLPHFPPEPLLITRDEDCTAPETPFEKYVYLFSFKQDDIDHYVEFFTNYTKLTPKFLGEEGDLDVRPPHVHTPLEIPYHYTRAYVHFLPGGYLNGQTVRISYCGKNKFNFQQDTFLHEWITKLHGDKAPKRILDIGTGNCHGALVAAQIFPQAEVIGIDLSAPYIRFCRMWAKQLEISNVKFYQDNGESSSFANDTFDIIQYSYVLHEMPAVNAMMVLQESYRLLVPGGVLTGFEVPFLENPLQRAMAVASQTWGYKWDSDGPKGPEPFCEEYQNKFVIPDRLAEVGFIDNTEVILTRFDAVYNSKKPEMT
jgi:ubiquinone/menaquinone biosynthesis C-methylase UbiE